MARRHWILLTAFGLVLVVIIVFSLPPPKQKFDRTKWIANPANGRWISENLRYNMAPEAAALAAKCHSQAEVLELLGSPENDGPYGHGSKGANVYQYSLGFARHPFLFWEAGADVFLEVMFDAKGREVRDSRVVEIGL